MFIGVKDVARNGSIRMPEEQSRIAWWQEWTKIGVTIAGTGFAGIVAWYLLTQTIPDAQSQFHEELRLEREHAAKLVKEERDNSNERARRAREHAKEVTEQLSNDIRMLTRTLDSHQSVVRDNQWRQIEFQQKQLDLQKKMAEPKEPTP